MRAVLVFQQVLMPCTANWPDRAFSNGFCVARTFLHWVFYLRRKIVLQQLRIAPKFRQSYRNPFQVLQHRRVVFRTTNVAVLFGCTRNLWTTCVRMCIDPVGRARRESTEYIRDQQNDFLRESFTESDPEYVTSNQEPNTPSPDPQANSSQQLVLVYERGVV